MVDFARKICFGRSFFFTALSSGREDCFAKEHGGAWRGAVAAGARGKMKQERLTGDGELFDGWHEERETP